MKAIDLFCGAGGLSMGLKRAGFTVVVCVDSNRDAMETYASHEPDAVHYNMDVRELSFAKYRGTVDLVAGGPPCQPFSIGGLRKAHADSRDMIPEFIRCLNEVQPRAFIMENVPGLVLRRTRPYFESVIFRLAECGYRLTWAILNAADYGVPQKRRRLFVLGARDMRLSFPVPVYGPGHEDPYVSALEVLGSEAIGEAPNCPVRYARYPDLRPSPYAGHIYNGGGRPVDPSGPSHTILASSGGYKTHWIDSLGIAPEYHAHLLAGGRPREGIVPGARRLSVEECAILQTFPRDLAFAGKRSSQYRQVGDAVPPDLAYTVARAVHGQLNGATMGLLLSRLDIEGTSIQCQLAV